MKAGGVAPGDILLGRNRTTNAAKLTQRACLLDGLCYRLSRTRGRFAVIIHSYMECANAIPGMVQRLGNNHFFCTNLSENDVISGTASERLMECIHLVAEHIQPEIIYVLDSCVSELIGDDILQVARRAAEKIETPVEAVKSSGLHEVTQRKIIDMHACLMARACDPEQKKVPLSINAIGFNLNDCDVIGIIESLGLNVNCLITGDSDLSEWKKLPRGALNVIPDQRMYEGLADFLSATCGASCIELPLPLGLENTERFIMGIARHFSIVDKAQPVVNNHREKHRKAAQEFADGFKGMIVGYNVGSMRDYEPATLANDGLAGLRLYKELGFRIVLMIQGSDDTARRHGIQEQLRRNGYEAPFRIFQDTRSLSPLLKKDGVHLFHGADFLREEARAAGVHMLDVSEVEPGFAGFTRTAKKIAQRLGAAPRSGPGGA